MKLDLLLKKTRISQTKLAEDLGVSKTIVSLWATGKQMPSYKNLQRIAEYFNIKVKSLY